MTGFQQICYICTFSDGRESPTVIPDELQQVRLNLVGPDDCADQINGYSFNYEITDRMIWRGTRHQWKGSLSGMFILKFIPICQNSFT